MSKAKAFQQKKRASNKKLDNFNKVYILLRKEKDELESLA